MVVNPLRPLDLAVEPRRPWPDVDVSDLQRLEVPVKVRLEFGAIVRLHDEDPERETSEARRSMKLIAVAWLHASYTFSYTNPSAIVDRRELIEPLPRAGNPLEELDVHLQAVAGLGLLIALPSLVGEGRCFWFAGSRFIPCRSRIRSLRRWPRRRCEIVAGICNRPEPSSRTIVQR